MTTTFESFEQPPKHPQDTTEAVQPEGSLSYISHKPVNSRDFTERSRSLASDPDYLAHLLFELATSRQADDGQEKPSKKAGKVEVELPETAPQHQIDYLARRFGQSNESHEDSLRQQFTKMDPSQVEALFLDDLGLRAAAD